MTKKYYKNYFLNNGWNLTTETYTVTGDGTRMGEELLYFHKDNCKTIITLGKHNGIDIDCE